MTQRARRFQDLPPVGGSSLEPRRVQEAYTRREVLRGGLAVSAMAIGLSFVGGITTRLPAFAGMQCSTSGLTFNPSCVPSNIATTCGDGCNREPSVSNTTFCYGTSYGARHKTCGELVWFTPDKYRDHQIRTNECGGSYDGWRWAGVDSGTCCVNGSPHFYCKDGYYRLYQYGSPTTSWLKSICETFGCF